MQSEILVGKVLTEHDDDDHNGQGVSAILSFLQSSDYQEERKGNRRTHIYSSSDIKNWQRLISEQSTTTTTPIFPLW